LTRERRKTTDNRLERRAVRPPRAVRRSGLHFRRAASGCDNNTRRMSSHPIASGSTIIDG
jgi:hypothetical protein